MPSKRRYKDRPAGTLGTLGCFSFHPLKNLNVWGDGGIVTTNSDELAGKLRLLRNHGLMNRDQCAVFAYNSRLDTLQAVVARHLLTKLDHITRSRIANARYFDERLGHIPQIKIARREATIKQVYHLYIIRCDQRDALQKYLVAHAWTPRFTIRFRCICSRRLRIWGISAGISRVRTDRRRSALAAGARVHYARPAGSRDRADRVVLQGLMTMQVPFVGLQRQFHDLHDELVAAFERVGASGMYIMGEELERFESAAAIYCGTRHALGVANGSDALFLVLKALGIGAGDEVITCPNSFIASAWVIVAAGAKPVLVDAGEDYNIDAGKLESAITSRTRAIIPVHLTGRPRTWTRSMRLRPDAVWRCSKTPRRRSAPAARQACRCARHGGRLQPASAQESRRVRRWRTDYYR